MRHLQKYLAAFADPRNALLAAALVAGAGIVASYVEFMEEADRELALRQGPPAQVEVQNFRAGRDVGPAEEVRLVAEIDLTAAVTVPVRGSGAAKWHTLIPVFPVSDLGSALITRRDATEDAVLSAQVERRAIAGSSRRSAIGFITVPSAGPDAGILDASEFAEEVLGDGRAGTVIALNGELIEPGPLTHVADGAFAVQDVTLTSEFVAVAPYLDGRLAALTTARPVSERRPLFLTALALLILAAVLQARAAIVARNGDDDTDGEADSDTEGEDVQHHPSRHPEFAPIPSQREIRAADKIAAEQAVEPHPARVFIGTLASGVWAMIWLAGTAALQRIRDVRNRRSHPEDEAL